MSTTVYEQTALALFTDPITTRQVQVRPGWRAEATPRLGWAACARELGEGVTIWLFFRRLVWNGRAVWETWEPPLPYGVAHVYNRLTAMHMLADLVKAHGDEPIRITS